MTHSLDWRDAWAIYIATKENWASEVRLLVVSFWRSNKYGSHVHIIQTKRFFYARLN